MLDLFALPSQLRLLISFFNNDAKLPLSSWFNSSTFFINGSAKIHGWPCQKFSAAKLFSWVKNQRKDSLFMNRNTNMISWFSASGKNFYFWRSFVRKNYVKNWLKSVLRHFRVAKACKCHVSKDYSLKRDPEEWFAKTLTEKLLRKYFLLIFCRKILWKLFFC